MYILEYAFYWAVPNWTGIGGQKRTCHCEHWCHMKEWLSSKGVSNPKIKFVLFERTLKITEYLSVFYSLASFLRYIRAMTYRRMLYIFAIIKRYNFKCTCLVLWEKHTHMITSKWFRFTIAKIYNILRYVIPRDTTSYV